MNRGRSRRFVPVLLAGALASCGGPPPGAPTEEVFLPPGTSFSATIDSLVAHKIIANRRWFSLAARIGRYDRSVRAGLYEFRQGEATFTVLKILAKGSEKTIRFTVPEGFTVQDIAEAAEIKLGLSADSIEAAAQDSAVLREFGVPGESMEGFLSPETYFVSKLISARELVREMGRLFQRGWRPEWNQASVQAGLSRRDVVTLASIVEGEAKVDDDRPVIAAVYLNRLRNNMPLQADPTVQYALQLATGTRKPRLLLRDYDFPSPYNTYLHAGLPPRPVGAPSSKSIDAVLHPAPVPYLYFVAGLDGKHVFSRTYTEHLRNIATIRAAEQRTRRSNGGAR
jgi:UPF0755 protein